MRRRAPSKAGCCWSSAMLGCLVITLAAQSSNQLNRIVSSEAGLRLSPQPAVAWRNISGGVCPLGSVEVLTNERMQVMGGFGASMTESSAINLNSLPPHRQAELLELLYGTTGARLSAMKATMLANDFAAAGPWSTYDDTAGDVKLAHFTIERDLKPNGSLSLIKRAIAAGFEGTIQAYMDFP